jgi:hypothetical protein
MLIGTFCLSEGEEYPGKVCDIGFETPCIGSKEKKPTLDVTRVSMSSVVGARKCSR